MATAANGLDGGVATVCMLASGSKGNCIHVSAADQALLIDAGLSGREIERRLAQGRLSPDNIQAIVVSHEHTDHVRGVGVLARRYGLPVYISAKTEAAANAQLGTLPHIRYFKPGFPFEIAPFTLHPFSVSHDAVDPVGFTISMNGCRIGIATDLGIATGLVEDHLKDCHLLVIEANHDPDMLLNGPYPWSLKQRIKSRRGHLSNEAAEALLREVLNAKLKHIILGHLSETNNSRRHALQKIKQGLGNRDICVTVARQDRCGPVLML